MDILFLIINIAIFIQYINLLSRWGITRSAEKFIFAYFLLMVQIIASLLFLGAIGYLYPLPAIAINLVIIFSLTYFVQPIPTNPPAIPGWRLWGVTLAPLSNKLIALYSVFILGWLLLCAYFLPPRATDEIAYHLPFIYQSIQNGRWTLLPTDLHIEFAYPMNTEVFYSWPVLILGNTRWVNACQIPIGVWTSGIIYLFGRHFGIRRTKAFFLAGIFLLTPIVMAQMGTNYVDVATAGFLLSSLYLTIRFLITSQKIYVRLAFLSIGTMMGIKYPLLCWGLILAFILFFILIRKKWKGDFLWGLITVSGLGLGWHLRNFLVFSNWLYPCTRKTSSDLGMVYHSAGEIFISLTKKLTVIFIYGVNNGTVDGGFGRNYGLIIIVSWVLSGWWFLFRKGGWKKGEILFFLIALSFLLILIPMSKDSFPWLGPRVLLAAWPIFLLIFGRNYFVLTKNPWVHKLLIVICLLGLVQDTKAFFNSPRPAHHWWGKSKMSKFESYRFSNWYTQRLGVCTTYLDVMTQTLPRRATVFLAAPSREFWSAPFYGSFLQTRIINFDPQFKGDPDFLVYFTVTPEPLTYVGNYQKTLPEAMSSEYPEVISIPNCKIFANPRLFKGRN